jgi:hypothetical protein
MEVSQGPDPRRQLLRRVWRPIDTFDSPSLDDAETWLFQAAVDATASPAEVVGCAVWTKDRMDVHRFGHFFPGEVESLGAFSIAELGFGAHHQPVRAAILELESTDSPDPEPDHGGLIVEAFVELKLGKGVTEDRVVSLHDQLAGELLAAGAYTGFMRDLLNPEAALLCTPPYCLNPSADQERGGLCSGCAKEHGADFSDFLDG